MSSQPLLVLDIGATKVACAVGLPHEHGPGFELLGSSLAAYPFYPDSWLSDPLMVSRTIEQAVEATAVRNDFDRAIIIMSHPALASEHVKASLPLADEPVPVRAQDLQRLQAAALDRALGVDREPLVVERLGCDGNGFEGVRNPRGLPATRLSGLFHVVTMPVAARRAIVQAVESAGLEVSKLIYSLQAIVSGVSDDDLANRRVLVLDAGGLTTDIGLFMGGTLVDAATVPQGGTTLGASVAKQLHTTLEQGAAWSLQGVSCPRDGVKAIVEEHWMALADAIQRLTQRDVKPDSVIVSGRAGLIDGFAEWVERSLEIPTSIGRSARLIRNGDVARQVGLTAAVGALELITRVQAPAAPRSPKFINRLIDRTRTILTEYF